MLPIDPGDGQGSVTPARPVEDIVPLRDDMVPAQAMSRGGTIIRPGAVAWGGMRDSTDSGYFSCEAIERVLASVAADPGQLPGLLIELTTTRLWVPLPVRHRPFTDGTAVRLPLIEAEGEDFVPCFTSVQRLTAWVNAADIPRAAPAQESQFAESGRRWQRAGDARLVPHLVVPAVGLARRLPSGLGLALNADGANGLPLYPESVSYLARLVPAETTAEARQATAVGVGHPPVEPRALLDETRAGLRGLGFVRYASRAWLSVPGAGEGLVISVALDDPGSEARRGAVIDALERARAAVPLRVPFPVDVTFPGEVVGDETSSAVSASVFPSSVSCFRQVPSPQDPPATLIDKWITRNTRPFYTRD